MKWISAKDIEYWASTNERDCQALLPQLISRLIRATSEDIVDIQFPSGDMVRLPGYDGVLELVSSTPFLPKGVSLFEIGTSNNPREKANRDKKSRDKNSLGHEKSDSTFVFVTPRVWALKENWRQRELQKGEWVNILVFDAARLEEWLELAPPVAIWLAELIRKLPPGIRTVEYFWKEWSQSEKNSIAPDLLIASRNEEVKVLDNYLCAEPKLVGVASYSRKEALAFVAATILLFETAKKERLLSRTFIVSDPNLFRVISTNTKQVILIPDFEEKEILFAAVKEGHHVVIPMDFVDGSKLQIENKIELPRIEYEDFIQVLETMGFSREEARRLSRETTRNITLVRRELGFLADKPKWAASLNSRVIIPALLAGRWDEGWEGDRKIIELLAGKPYDKYIEELSTWLHTPDPPVSNIGTFWRLVSPYDTWNYLGSLLTKNDYQNIQKYVLEVLPEKDPALDLPTDYRFAASLFGKSTKFSSSLRDGLSQSLTLTAYFGKEWKLKTPVKPTQVWVDQIAAQMFAQMDQDKWRSLNKILPQLAEASPIEFLNCVTRGLRRPSEGIESLFEKGDSFLFGPNYFVPLLWALQQLAWDETYLSRVTAILVELTSKSGIRNVEPQPRSSLSMIYSLIMPQTLVPFDERMGVLLALAKHKNDEIFNLLLSIVPHSHSIGTYNQRPRWRSYQPITKIRVTNQQILSRLESVNTSLVDMCGNNGHRWAVVIQQVPNFHSDGRKRIIESLSARSGSLNEGIQAWGALRDLIYRHKKYSKQDWALPNEEINSYENVLTLLEPEGSVLKNKWLFEEYHPLIEEFIELEDIRSERKVLHQCRVAALKEMILDQGLDNILKLIYEVDNSGILASICAYLPFDQEIDIKILTLLKGKDSSEKWFVSRYIATKSDLKGLEWVENIYYKLKDKEIGGVGLGIFLSHVRPSKDVWKLVEQGGNLVTRTYWENYSNCYAALSPEDRIVELENLLKVRRYFFALEVVSNFKEEIPTPLLADLLATTATENGSDRPKGNLVYKISETFLLIDGRNDLTEEELASLEWVWLPVLTSSHATRKPITLFKRLKKSPEFFIEMIRFIYKPKGKEQLEQELVDGLEPKIIRSRGKSAHNLLEIWTQIPGFESDNLIQKKELWDWIEKAKKLAIRYDRVGIVDFEIGRMLSKFSMKETNWPPEDICEILDSFDSEKINSGFYNGTFNRLGKAWMGSKGGNRYKERATLFESYAREKDIRWPITAQILRELASSYQSISEDSDLREEKDSLEY